LRLRSVEEVTVRGALYTPTSAVLTGCADTVADFRLFTGSKIPVAGESSVSVGHWRRIGFGGDFPSGCFLFGRLLVCLGRSCGVDGLS
jgi:hypothetical protein